MAVGAALLMRPAAAASFRRPPTPERRKHHLARPRFWPRAQQRQIPQKETEAKPDAGRLRRRVSFPSAARLLDRIRGDEIGLQILNIALPAALALAADPITSLVDTAFVGHLGSVELAAVGVSVSVFNLVSKLFNIPLLNVTTSFVAEQQAVDCDINHNAGKDEASDNLGKNPAEGRKFLPAVTTSLVLAAGFGIAEAIALICGSGLLLNFMGIPVDSPMRVPAEQFLSLRAYGAPPIVIALAAQGTFRGFKDTKTPLYAVCAGNLLNAILDPILIFLLGLGIGGAAIATVLSEYLIAFLLLWKLNEKVILVSSSIVGDGFSRYLKSAGLLVGRTIAVLLTMTLSTSLAARGGPVPMAGHQICLQVWLAISLLNDALALAGQALLASEYTQKNYKQARLIMYKVLQIGASTGVALAIFLFFEFEPFSTLFTTDPAVLEIARSGVLFVTISQPINAIAFVIDGLYYGVSDFGYAAYSMILVSLVSSLFLVMSAPAFGLAGVWTGLVLFMSLRAGAGFWRIKTKGGPWKKLCCTVVIKFKDESSLAIEVKQESDKDKDAKEHPGETFQVKMMGNKIGFMTHEKNVYCTRREQSIVLIDFIEKASKCGLLDS